MMKSNFKCLHSKIGFSFSLQTCSYFRENVTVFEWRIRGWAGVWWKAWGNFTYCRTQNIFYQKSCNTSELNHEILFTKSNSVWIYTIFPRVCYLFLWHCKQQNDLIFARNFKKKFTYFFYLVCWREWGEKWRAKIEHFGSNRRRWPIGDI